MWRRFVPDFPRKMIQWWRDFTNPDIGPGPELDEADARLKAASERLDQVTVNDLSEYTRRQILRELEAAERKRADERRRG